MVKAVFVSLGPIGGALLLGVATQLSTLAPPEVLVRFDREIRPILSDNCFKCHGPDAGSRHGGLRLDTLAGATAMLPDGRFAIVPGDSTASVLLHRITSPDVGFRMPPPESHKSLTQKEIELLRRWIDEGAIWQEHWSLVPPIHHAPPLAQSDWPRDEIDRFIFARLSAEGLVPSPEASPEIRFRRVTLDLTGLPPSIEEMDAFLADASPDAYEEAVDRLLASPRFGERMAVPWLDIARYADSYGYQSDQLSPTWPYRDWVVRAFNSNLPYDQFVTWQLAGDLLPRATREQRLATAFNRLHRMTNEGGSIELEYRTEYAADRTQTFATAFMGLTLECARCHDHKFDAISQREYYSLFAFFNNIEEWGMYNDSSRVPTPSLLLPTPEQERIIADCEATLAEANIELTANAEQQEPAFQAWLMSDDRQLDPELPRLVGHYPLDEIGEENHLANLAQLDKPGSTSPANRLVPGYIGQGLAFTGDDAASFPNVAGGLNPWDQFSVVFWLWLPEDLSDCILLHRSGGTDVGRFGAELSVVEGHLRLAHVRFWPGNAIAVQATGKLPAGRWTHVAISYDASATASGLKIYADGRPLSVEVLKDRLTKSPSAGGHGITFGERFRDVGLKDGKLDDLRVFSRPLAAIEVAHLFGEQSLAVAIATRNPEATRSYYLAAIDETMAIARQTRATAVHELFKARDAVMETMVMEELSITREAFLLSRGAYDAPRTEDNRVERGTPASLSPFPPDASRDRLGLARWLTDPAHPLAARVAVNRIWQVFFGRGLVETSEDFGAQGSSPTHPELLDWMAVQFVQSDWDVKALCRRIVTSATYRQASGRRADRDLDPANELLARGPSRRLSAEMLRDLALAASGLLDESREGPPVSPYQPPGLWRESNTMSPGYQQSVDTALYRRSLYTVWKRTAPMPNMLVFDAATREACSARRQTTSSPIQALVLLNDPQFVEAARVLGERMIREGGDTDSDRTVFAFRLLTGRSPAKGELALLLELYVGERIAFAAEPDLIAQFQTVGSHHADESLDAADAAAAGIVALAILNMDATVWKR